MTPVPSLSAPPTLAGLPTLDTAETSASVREGEGVLRKKGRRALYRFYATDSSSTPWDLLNAIAGVQLTRVEKLLDAADTYVSGARMKVDRGALRDHVVGRVRFTCAPMAGDAGRGAVCMWGRHGPRVGEVIGVGVDGDAVLTAAVEASHSIAH